MRHLKSLSTTSTLNLLYPRLLAIHDLKEDIGFPMANNGRLKLPRFMRASYAYMVAEGAYLMCTSSFYRPLKKLYTSVHQSGVEG